MPEPNARVARILESTQDMNVAEGTDVSRSRPTWGYSGADIASLATRPGCSRSATVAPRSRKRTSSRRAKLQGFEDRAVINYQY